jgi:hypothetical protein
LVKFDGEKIEDLLTVLAESFFDLSSAFSWLEHLNDHCNQLLVGQLSVLESGDLLSLHQ